MDRESDVLIVGAGPAGLTLAHCLHRQGIRVRIVDKDPGPTEGTRAPVLWQRTQEILAALGIRDAWLPESDLMSEESLHLYGKAIAPLPTLDSRSPYSLPFLNTQSFTEQILSRTLEEAGLDVEFDTEAVAYRETDGTSEVDVRRKDGTTETIRAGWVAAAEGANSVIRKAVGLDFKKKPYAGYRIHVADVLAKWTYATPVGQAYFFIREKGYMGGQRLPGDPNRFYFYILTEDEDPEGGSKPIDMEGLQGLVRSFSGDDGATVSELCWGNSAHYSHGCAETFRKGRALLLGDTARIVVPLYGQGMNYAIHDAWNLGWKLAHVVRGLAPEGLIDTYVQERRGLAIELDDKITSLFNLVTEPKPLQAPAIRALAPVALSSDVLRHAISHQSTEMDLTYAGYGISEAKSGVGNLAGGDRFPAVWCKRLPDCDSTNTLDLFDGNRWTVVLAYGADAEDEPGEKIVAWVRSLEARYGDLVRTVLLWGAPKRPSSDLSTILVDAEDRFSRDHDLPARSVFLVRPDGYIAVAGEDAHEIDALLSRWLNPIA